MRMSNDASSTKSLVDINLPETRRGRLSRFSPRGRFARVQILHIKKNADAKRNE